LDKTYLTIGTLFTKKNSFVNIYKKKKTSKKIYGKNKLHTLFNKGYEILPNLTLERKGQNYNYYSRIQEHETKEGFKLMSRAMQLD